MAEKKVYGKFRELLKEAIGSTPQKEYAAKCGLSDSHLNRLLKNTEIAQPSIDTLQKILRTSPFINGYDLYQACNYSSEDLYRTIWKGISVTKASEILTTSLKNGFLSLRAERKVWDSKTQLIETYMQRSGWMLQSIETLGVSENTDDNHEGLFVLRCKAVWISGYEMDGYYQSKTNFLIYGYLLADEKILFTDIATDGLSLYRANHTDNAEDILYEEGRDVRTLPNLTFTTKKKHSEKGKHLFEILTGESDKLFYNMKFGIGVPYKGMPENFLTYVLKNQKYLQNNPRAVEILEELESLETQTVEKIENTTKDYIAGFCDGRGVIAMLIDILNGKASELEHPFTIEYCFGAYDDLCDSILVDEDNWISYGRLDEERETYIKQEFHNLIQELGYEEPDDVIIYYNIPIDIQEFHNYLKK